MPTDPTGLLPYGHNVTCELVELWVVRPIIPGVVASAQLADWQHEPRGRVPVRHRVTRTDGRHRRAAWRGHRGESPPRRGLSHVGRESSG